MTDPIKITSACYAKTPIDGEHSLREMAIRGKLNIRGNGEDSQFADAIRAALNVPLPLKPNTMQERESRRLYWLGPNEWLLYCDLDELESLQATLRDSLSGMHHAVTDVSDYYTVLRLRSPEAKRLLRMGSPLDIHHSRFSTDDIAQTRFGHASVLLHKLGDGESWNIQVRWTYAEYVWDYLVSGMRALNQPG